MTSILPIMFVIAKLLLISQSSSATDTITQFQSLSDGKTMASQDGSFELGFFSPSSSTNRYVGIWYKNIPETTVVWVANRDNPIKDNSGMLNISKEGNLVLLSQNNTIHWSTNATTKTFNVTAQLLDNGNLVLRDEKDNNPQIYLWQSFDYPCDTLLPEMKIGWDLKAGLNRRLTAWNNWDDPSTSDFTLSFAPNYYPEFVMMKGSTKYHRGGPWNSVEVNDLSPSNNATLGARFVSNKNELYFTYGPKNKSGISRLVLNKTVYAAQRYTWIEEAKTWRMSSEIPRDYCDSYNLCGPFGNCVIGASPLCQCLPGYKPKSPQNWDAMDWTEGCVRNDTWGCREENKDGFLKLSNMKTPDVNQTWDRGNMTLEECKAKCWENCTCTAFANLEIQGEGSNCTIWFDGLLDLRQASNAGQDMYIRLAVPASTTGNNDTKGDSKKKVVVATASTVASILVMVSIFTFIYWRTKRKVREKIEIKRNDECEDDLEVPLFDLATIVQATDDFSNEKKLGEGGFGPVYKGTLPTGQDVAVKRLSQTSAQGSKEFKNEVIFCAKLQHRNLVKVLGCCIQEEERLLIYEYMPNKSLNSFIFDPARSKLLSWSNRFYIINGIARGLLYLHQDSRFRIIHRDLKASNVLLDEDMNPKISDFGLARLCGGDQIEGNTSRVVGTYGYMAPEYAFYGLFSIKSDVFSFGILLLEIVSGKKNTGFSNTENNYNLIGHAWRLWKEGIPIELIDTCLEDSYIRFEVLRCIHIALLCLQHHPDDRPDMTSVVVMLSSDIVLPQPKEPGFLIEKVSNQGESVFEINTSSSNNDVTMSLLDAR